MSGITADFGFTDTMRPPPVRMVSNSSATSCFQRSGRARSQVAAKSCATLIAIIMRRSSGAVSRRSSCPLRTAELLAIVGFVESAPGVRIGHALDGETNGRGAFNRLQ